ncbi:MAG: hypothetical protein PVJ30_03330 [Thiohalocapsa sp.]|jgi:hypothetical protein
MPTRVASGPRAFDLLLAEQKSWLGQLASIYDGGAGTKMLATRTGTRLNGQTIGAHGGYHICA